MFPRSSEPLTVGWRGSGALVLVRLRAACPFPPRSSGTDLKPFHLRTCRSVHRADSDDLMTWKPPSPRPGDAHLVRAAQSALSAVVSLVAVLILIDALPSLATELLFPSQLNTQSIYNIFPQLPFTSGMDGTTSTSVCKAVELRLPGACSTPSSLHCESATQLLLQCPGGLAAFHLHHCAWNGKGLVQRVGPVSTRQLPVPRRPHQAAQPEQAAWSLCPASSSVHSLPS